MYRLFSIYTVFMFKCGTSFYMLSEDSDTCGCSRTYPLHILMDDHINNFDFSFFWDKVLLCNPCWSELTIEQTGRNLLQSSCICLLSIAIIRMHHHKWFHLKQQQKLFFEATICSASKGSSSRAWQSDFTPWDPHGGRRELTSKSCLSTSQCCGTHPR